MRLLIASLMNSTMYLRRLLLLTWTVAVAAVAADRPNILWLTSEDNGPHYGCYGDTYATTPNIDALAAKGLRFKRCWSNAPVCAPARTCLISGRFAPADGAEHMRSLVPMPQGHKMYPQLLREAGYYCTNNSKEDYNLAKPKGGKTDLVWDDSSGKAHWQNRNPGQPFFAIFNDIVTHESQIRRKPHTLVHDPAKAPVPPFYPDTPEVRRDWAQYYDNLTTMDAKLGEYLAELEKAGEAGNTIIMQYGDHGPGMARFKRWPYNSGLQVGLIMYFPPKWKHLAPKGYAANAVSDELVSFIDLPATLLSIAGVEPPAYFQGRAICGPFAKPAPAVIHGFRGRMDERYDLVRSVTDGRYVYIRHYMPHLPYGQFLNYMFQQASTRAWKDAFDAGQTNELQSRFWKPKPSEELYDLEADPWETVNLAEETAHVSALNRLRAAHRDWVVRCRDLGFIPEAERFAKAGEGSPKDAFASEESYPIQEVLNAADLATDRTKTDVEAVRQLLGTPNAVVRYWGIIGALVRGEPAIRSLGGDIAKLLGDASPSVRIAAAEALANVAESQTMADRCVMALMKASNVNERPYFEAVEAMNALDRLQPKLTDAQRTAAANLPGKAPKQVEGRLKEYIARLHDRFAGPP